MSKHKSQAPKINLAVAGSSIKVDDDYFIQLPSEDHIIVKAGVVCGKPATSFTHPNLAIKTDTMFAFKHYFKNGGKKWYEKAGVQFVFIVPKSAINVHVDKGYSFVDAEINGVAVTFNVTGGSGGDWIGAQAEIFCNHSVRDLKRIADVSIRDPEIEKTITVNEMDAGEKKRWAQQSAKKNKSVMPILLGLLKDGKAPVIKVLDGFSIGNIDSIQGEFRSVTCRKKRIYRYDENKKIVGWGYDYEHGAVKTIFIKTDNFGCVKVKPDQVDWVGTAKMNGIAI